MKIYTRKDLPKIGSYILEFLKEREELNREFIINEVSIATLKSIIVTEPNDKELYLSYILNELQAEIINKNLNTPIPFDFEKFEYYFQRYIEQKGFKCPSK